MVIPGLQNVVKLTHLTLKKQPIWVMQKMYSKWFSKNPIKPEKESLSSNFEDLFY